MEKYRDLALPTEDAVQSIFRIMDSFMKREASFGNHDCRFDLHSIATSSANPHWTTIHRCPYGKVESAFSEVLKRFHAKKLRIRLKDPEHRFQDYTPETWASLDGDRYTYQVIICWD